MSEAAFFFDLSSARLRARCRLGGLALAASVLAPYEVVGGRAQFFWQLIGELSPVGMIALFAPAAAGVVLATASKLVTRATSLAIVALSALAASAVVVRLGAESVRWDALSLPDVVAHRSTLVELALGFTAAGAALAFRDGTRRVSQAVLGLAAVFAALFYAIPARGEAPFTAVIEGVRAMAEVPSFRLQLGLLLLVIVASWPALVAFGGLVHLRTKPAREHPPMTVLAIFGLPALLLMFAYRAVLVGAFGPGLLVSIGAAFTTLARVAVIASSVEILGAVASPASRLELGSGLLPKRAALAGALGVVAIAAGTWALARPPVKGVEWIVEAPQPVAEKLFGELLPAWTRARAAWDGRVRQEPSTRALLAMKSAAREAVAAAKSADSELGASLEALLTETDDVDLAGRRWFHLVADVNEASRRAKIPYYVDPLVYVFTAEEGPVRLFRLQSYRITKVNKAQTEGKPFAALFVTAAGARESGNRLLGFSRDAQPFALVQEDEIRRFATTEAELARATPPVCLRSADAAHAPALERCGALLAKIVNAAPDGLSESIATMTERHELQHQIDGPDLPLSHAVRRHVPWAQDDFQDRVNRELSAYVAQFASTAPPALGLVDLVSFAFVPRGAEHRVALIALEELGKRSVSKDGRVDPEAVDRVLDELSALGDDELRDRARKAWRALFGGALAEVK